MRCLHFGNPAYAAAKAGMVAYARAIAVEEGARGVRANVVCPGSVKTAAWTHRLESASQPFPTRWVRHYPLGRIVEPEEVAQAVLFLASPLASGITGAVLPVDAGLTAGNLRFVRDIIEGGLNYVEHQTGRRRQGVRPRGSGAGHRPRYRGW